MSNTNINWSDFVVMKKPVKKVQRSISFNEDTLKNISALTDYINESSISETIEQILSAYIEYGEIADLEGNVHRVKDVIKVSKEKEETAINRID